MPNDSELRIMIKFLADLQAAKDAEAAEKRLNEEAQKGAQASGTLSQKSQDLASKLKNQAAEAKGAEISHRELHEVVEHLSGGNNELAGTISRLYNPYIALAVAIGAVVKEYMEQKAALDEYLASPLPDMEWNDIQRKEALAKVVADVAAAYQEYGRQRAWALGEGGAVDRAEKADAAAIAAAGERSNAEISILQSQLKVQEAAIDGMEADGVISHSAALARKLKADEAYEQARQALEKSTRDGEIKALEGQQRVFKDDAEMGEKNIPKRAKESADADAASKDNSDRAADLAANIAKEKDDLKAAQKEADDANAQLNSLGPFTDPTGKRREVARATGDAASSRGEADSSNIRFMESQRVARVAAQPQLDADAKTAANKLTELEQSTAKAADRVTDLKGQIAGLQTANDIKSASDATIAANKGLAGAEGVASELARNPTELAQIGGALNQGQKLTDGQQAQLDALEQVLGAAGESQSRILDTLKRMATMHGGVQDQINEINAALAKISGQKNTFGVTGSPQ